MESVYDQRVTTTISLESSYLKELKQKGLNLSKVCNDAVRIALAHKIDDDEIEHLENEMRHIQDKLEEHRKQIAKGEKAIEAYKEKKEVVLAIKTLRASRKTSGAEDFLRHVATWVEMLAKKNIYLNEEQLTNLVIKDEE